MPAPCARAIAEARLPVGAAKTIVAGDERARRTSSRVPSGQVKRHSGPTLTIGLERYDAPPLCVGRDGISPTTDSLAARDGCKRGR
jgi:hypothetical protein